MTEFDTMIENKIKKNINIHNSMYNKSSIVKSIKNPNKWDVIDLDKHVFMFYYKYDGYNTTSQIKNLIEDTTGKKIESIYRKHEIVAGCFSLVAQEYLEITFEN